MNILALSTSVVWVDFIVIVLSKFVNLGKSLDTWYKQFGIVAVMSDCLIILLGILLTRMIFPHANIITFIVLCVIVQLIHDILFYLFVIKKLGVGENSIIDLFKQYSAENSYKVLIADSLMVIASVILYTYLKTLTPEKVIFTGLLGAYAMTYIIYTK
jgi:hypothetical protein